MKKTIVLLLLPFFACNPPKADVKEILKADKEFSDMCMDKGMPEAFVHFAADDVVKLQPQDHPVMNKPELEQMFAEHASDGILRFEWKPVKADIAASGDLGYTFGNWTIFVKGDATTKDTTIYGNYVSIWKKQKDGSWKYVLDSGNATPPPDADY